MRDDSDTAGTIISRRGWIGSSAGILLSGCAGATSAAGPRVMTGGSVDAPSLDIPRLMRLASVPGLSLAAIGDGQPELRGYGVRRAGTTDAVTEDTVFEAASLSKPVFAYLLLLLEGEGRIDLDRPAGDYLTLPNPTDARARAITVRHLLSHSGGWRNWRFAREHVLTADFEPGARFSYSGEGYAFLQRIVESLTGRALPVLARERVFAPLGMASSSFVWRPDTDGRLAAPHSRGDPQESYIVRTGRSFRALEDEWGKPLEEWRAADLERALARVDASMPIFPNFLVPNAAGSLATTARDYAAFVRHLMGPGAPVLARMLQPAVRINEGLQWGLGLGLEQMEDGRTLFWHWGDSPGFKNFVVGEAASGHATVVFTNGNTGRSVYERVVRNRTGTDHPAFVWI